MRLLLDANIVLDCPVLEKSGLPRHGKPRDDQVFELCDQGIHAGLVARHTLPIVADYYGQQHSREETGAMIDGLLAVLEVPTVGHKEAAQWRTSGITDFEAALQIMSALAHSAEVIISRNVADFTGASIPVMTPEAFLASYAHPPSTRATGT